jgi:hypothetical protein
MKNLFKSIRHWNNQRVNARRDKTKLILNHDHRLGILGIMKNESMNILEWVEHYKNEGVTAIYLIDNGSTDDAILKLHNHIASGLVKLIELPEKHKQKQHYWTAIDHFKITEACEWLIVADIDEFWFCKDGTQLNDIWPQYHGYDVVYVNWSIFGSNGHIQHPTSLRKSLTKKQAHLASNMFTKWACRTSIIQSIDNIDIHKVSGGCSSRTIADNQTFQINHYVTQSKEYFAKVKMTRGDAVKALNNDIRDWAYFDQYDAPCTETDEVLSKRIDS